MAIKEKSFQGAYSRATVVYEAERIDHNTVKFRAGYKWVFSNSTDRKPDGNVGFFTYWIAVGYSLNNRKTYDRVIGNSSRRSSFSDIKRESRYEHVIWEKQNRNRLEIGDWNGIANGGEKIEWLYNPIYLTVKPSDTSIKFDIGILRPSCGSESNNEDLKWFHGGININPSFPAYKKPDTEGATLKLVGDKIRLSITKALTDTKHGGGVAKYRVKYSNRNNSKTITSLTDSIDAPNSLNYDVYAIITPIDENGVEGDSVRTNTVSYRYDIPKMKKATIEFDGDFIKLKYDKAIVDDKSGAARYRIKYSHLSGSKIVSGLTDTINRPNSFSYSVYATVMPIDTNGYEGASVKSNTITYDYQHPTVPEITLIKESQGSDKITVNWKHSKIDSQHSLSHYIIKIGGYEAMELNNEHIADIPLEPGTNIKVSVVCYDTSGNNSLASTKTITISGVTASTYTVSWQTAMPYVYDNGWKRVKDVYYYDGTKWKPCS